MTYLKARQLARQFFPNNTRRMRARWVLAKLKVVDAKVGISSHWPHDQNAFTFPRVSK
jgi:hypothetical protein